MNYDYEFDVPEEGRIKIGDDIILSFFRFSDSDLRIGCKVPKNILILREELYKKMKLNNPLNTSLTKSDKKPKNNIIQFPEKDPVEYEIRFTFACSDPSIPLPNIEIGENDP